MFAIKYCCDLAGRNYDFKVFETVSEAHKWWLDHFKKDRKKFYDVLFVVPPGLENPVQWCKDNIKEVASA